MKIKHKIVPRDDLNSVFVAIFCDYKLIKTHLHTKLVITLMKLSLIDLVIEIGLKKIHTFQNSRMIQNIS